VLYTVVPFLIIAVLFYYTAVVQTYVDKQSDHADVAVGVVANKWNWQFRYVRETYKDADGDDQVVESTGSSEEIPILVLPKGQRIRFEENSQDVIHSFWVPELLFKRDVIPGRTNSFEISSIDREGSYVGRCAELCGTYHSQMNFEVRVVSPEDYKKYIEGRKDGQTQAAALTAIGQEPQATTTHPFNTDRTSRQSS
jgi:cytochrome c oxidase subunit 2